MTEILPTIVKLTRVPGDAPSYYSCSMPTTTYYNNTIRYYHYGITIIVYYNSTAPRNGVMHAPWARGAWPIYVSMAAALEPCGLEL